MPSTISNSEERPDWNPTNPEWWRVNFEARPPEVRWQWLANEYLASLTDDERLDGPAPDTRTRLRDAIGTTDSDEGLPHWHHASGGTASDPRENDRAGVFVDRQAVLDAIDKVLG